MSIRKPEAFDRKVEESKAKIIELYGRLSEVYGEAYEVSLSPSVGESAGKITTSDPADPTGQIGFDHPKVKRPTRHAAIRRALDRAGTHMAEAENSIKAGEREILLAMDKLDPRPTFEALRNPISTNGDDQARYKEAQERRQGRGRVRLGEWRDM